jgi:hypothetical protein
MISYLSLQYVMETQLRALFPLLSSGWLRKENGRKAHNAKAEWQCEGHYNREDRGGARPRRGVLVWEWKASKAVSEKRVIT